MKKSVLVIALAFGVTGAFAQDLTSKKGEPILPEAGDWAISMDANPIFNYLGNAFNGNTSNSAPGTTWLNTDQTIIGKKFIDEKNAYRALLRLGFSNVTIKNMVADDANTAVITFPAQNPQVEDKFSSRSTNIAIGVGKEMRRGKTRLQGYYGADAMIWISMSSTKAQYGNIMSATNATGTTTNPETTDFYDADLDGDTGESFGTSNRKTITKSGMTFGIGVRGFIGAEYFIIPKISIGAEYGWGIGFQASGKGKTSTEEQGGTPNQVAVIERETSGSSMFGFDTDMNNGTMFGWNGSGSGKTGAGSLRVTFHF
ncbi:MAG: hypothetical protein H0X46_10295 [Bacteroidetes bacterium]|nr:hypothetical protein [Bacteroidota bacterium]